MATNTGPLTFVEPYGSVTNTEYPAPIAEEDSRIGTPLFKSLLVMDGRNDLHSPAVLEFESDGVILEVLTPGTTISKLSGFRDLEDQIYQDVTISPSSIKFESPQPGHFIHGFIPFAFVGNGDIIDILVTHGQFRQRLGGKSRCASLHFSGTTEFVSIDDITYLVCTPIPNDQFYTPGFLRFQTDWAEVQATTPGVSFQTLRGFDTEIRIGDSGQSVCAPGGFNFRHRVIPFVIVNDGGPIDITITHGRDGHQVGDLVGCAEVDIGEVTYTNPTIRDDPFNLLSFSNCPVLPPLPEQEAPEEVISVFPPGDPGVTSASNSSPSVQRSNQRIGNIYALIIGIDNYLHNGGQFLALTGAVADANDMYDFCISTLSVPEGRIKNLRNEQATRANIINSIRALGDDPRIQKDDAILIYYAGHGSQAPPPDRWPAKGLVQMILPYNFDPGSTKDSPIDDQGILDLQLAQLLDDLARKKSNNITFISDSCHSSAVTRSLRATSSVRSFLLPGNYSISHSLVNQLVPIIEPRTSRVARGFDKKGLSSHVLLSACQELEEAHEHEGRGSFTSALLGLLRERGIDGLSYTDVILRLPKLHNAAHRPQNPQCEGIHQYRMLFNGSVPTLKRQTFEIAGIKNKPGIYKLYAGEADGVMPDSSFAVYSNIDLVGDPLGYVQPVPPKEPSKSTGEATQVAFTICQNKSNSPVFDLHSQVGYAIQTDAGSAYKARLFLDLSNEHKAVFERVQEEMRANHAGSPQVEFVEDQYDKPDLVVTAQGQYAQFELMDHDCREQGLTHIPLTKTTIEHWSILRVLPAIANFYFHLRRSSKHSSYQILSANMSIECHRLAYTDIPVPGGTEKVLMPVESEGSLIEDGVLRLYSDPNTPYGYTISSKFTDGGLYAAFFYFDMSDLSISHYYLPNQARRGGEVYSIPPAGKALTVGYGESGTAPHTYTVRAGQDVDIGFLRLFVSTDYVDWRHIAQRSPFTLIDTRMSDTGTVQKALVGWGAKTIPVIITKS